MMFTLKNVNGLFNVATSNEESEGRREYIGIQGNNEML